MSALRTSVLFRRAIANSNNTRKFSAIADVSPRDQMINNIIRLKHIATAQSESELASVVAGKKK